ncbi:MAG: aminotransferase class V-fold PLP-dependent enzyme [Verrucomicrobiota bacterium]
MDLSGYFDFNATTPLLPRAREIFFHAQEAYWQNPSSLYHPAGATRRVLEEAREHVADLFQLDEPRRLIFTSGATEANNLVFRHVRTTAPADARVLISPFEHPCIRAASSELFRDHCDLLPLDAAHQIDLEAAITMLRGNPPAFVSLMAANNETGAQFPWESLLDACREESIPFHTDASQWLGKLPIRRFADCDWVTGSAHKFGGPKGVGFLIVPEDLTALLGTLLGGPQEFGLRAGTENAPAILALEAAIHEADQLQDSASPVPRDAFEERLREFLPEVRFLATEGARLWNTSLFVVPEHNNLKWLTRLSHHGFFVSTGSACSAGKGNPSQVLEALEVPYDDMGRVIRASGGWSTTEEDWLALAGSLHLTWKELNEPSTRSRKKRNIQL